MRREEGEESLTWEAWLHKHKRVAEMLQKDDWVSVWVGLATFLISWPFAAHGDSVVWNGQMEGALMGVISLLLLMVGPLAVLGSRFLKTEEVLPGFALMFTLAVAGKVIGGQAIMKKAGLGATVWTLLLGMLLSNVVARFTSIQMIQPAAKLAEFFIKIGLVLLAIELSTLGQYGIAGLLVAWCVTPICVAVIYSIGTRFIAPDSSRSLVCLLAAGISVCGGSAITATGSAIKAPAEEQALAISLVSFFTIFYMLALPYLALALGLELSVASAWIGGSVNNTGNVVASVAILDTSGERSDGGACPGPGCPSEMGPVIKMAQNAILGVVTVGISIYWMTYEEAEEGKTGTDIEMGVPDKVLKAQGLARSDAVAAAAAEHANAVEAECRADEAAASAGAATQATRAHGSDLEQQMPGAGSPSMRLATGTGAGGPSFPEAPDAMGTSATTGATADAGHLLPLPSSSATSALPAASLPADDLPAARGKLAATSHARSDATHEKASQGRGQRAKRPWPGVIALWDRFPKFVLGFLVLSCLISILAFGPMGAPLPRGGLGGEGGAGVGKRALDVLLEDLNRSSNWWFNVGFVGIGINTDVAKMAQKLKGGSILYLYLAGQTFNVLATLAVAWLAFDVAGLGPQSN